MGQTPGLYGVGFIVNKRHKRNIISFKGLSERVALLELIINNIETTIIQCYAPTTTASDEDIELFYSTVNNALKVSQKNIIVIGDFNAKIGQPNQDENVIMKSHGYGSRNNRGNRFIQFARENKFSILNTFFKKKNSKRWTWKSPDGKVKNEVDYILTNHPKYVHNIEVINVQYPSDHRLVRATFKLQNQRKNRKSYENNTNSPLKNEKEVKTYIESVHEAFENSFTWQQRHTVQELHDIIVVVIENSLKKAHDCSKNTNIPSVLSDKTKKLISRRQFLQKTKPKTRSMKNELKALYKLISKYIRHDYNSHRKKTIEKYVLQSGSLKRAHKELRQHKTWIEGLKTSNKITCNRNEILQVATKFYKTLYSCEQGREPDSALTLSKEISPDIEDIEEAEVLKGIARLKSEKSPGPDQIPNEALKLGALYLVNPLTLLFNLVLKTATTPKQWTESNIILLYKKGDPNDINNYRPISLLSSIYKLFSSILEKRIRGTLEKHQPIEQAGFRRGFSTVDHIHCIEMIIDKYQEFKRPLYIGFIDYRKAFDTLDHQSIWKSLESQNIEAKYLKVLQYLYKNCNSKIRLETTGPSIPIRRGVRQGDPISPTIFIAVLQQVIGQLQWERVGLNINNKFISHLRFADDIVLLSESKTELQSMLNDLHTASQQVGLEINRSKTNVMTNYSKSPVYLNNEALEYVDTYIYLGKQLSFQNKRNEQEIERRVSNAWKRFWSLKEIMKSDMPMKIKQKIMDTCILPTLTYASQTWKFTYQAKAKIRTCQRGMERSMLKIKRIQKISHNIIRKKTQVTDALIQCKKLKWRWAGHIARLSDNRWTARITSWRGPSGTRKRGRPAARWSDDIIQVAGKQWMETAKNRDTWKSLEEAFTFENEGFLHK
ncbi:hypothetical protein PYW07_011230 [Mythimna separata]|uniref:Reverse transcriptase domain-containing protein n=1 Tax=Mythimna separata TaxID=271217 RepID=A0AAD8DKL1_MYTSE|nr:hypothetical protein PYW07_011230 [Mythimna separata]